ncbi:Poly(U)-specific endoribonuclease-C [Chelonia mydas]|uniref:Uridylate-specific endoribonuclease n=1 Tax=Chelonia mydas TaxID=8469 RepID=M7AW74_CHEMY|nr:Poly(U)-specific endoribonuclease-C [Chelonia mydas]
MAWPRPPRPGTEGYKEEHDLVVVDSPDEAHDGNEQQEETHSDDSADDVDAGDNAKAFPPGSHAYQQQPNQLENKRRSEIRSISEALYSADVNKATSSEIILNLQHKISSDQTSAGQDYAKQKLFSYVDEDALFSKPTFARLLALLNNYERMTGKEEVVTDSERQEVDAFLDEIFKTGVMEKLSQFFLSKGEIKSGKVSGFHNWVHYYELEKNGEINYLSYSYNGPRCPGPCEQPATELALVKQPG